VQRTKTIGVAAVLLLSGLFAGTVLGLAIGSSLIPDRRGVATIEPQAQDELIVFIANTYFLDQDLYRAQTRLDQLDDPDITERIATLATAYAAKHDPAAARLALLAEDLGANDPEMELLARPATPTLRATATVMSSATPSATTTAGRTPTGAPARSATPRTTPTPTLVPVAAVPPPQWIPAFPTGWPGGIKYEPANVTPGQKYWRMIKAVYCDSNDEHDYCQDLPGGPLGTDTYVKLIGENGERASAPIQVVDSNGTVYEMEEKSPTDSCNCNYGFLSSGFTFKVLGAPSDTITGLALYSVKAKLSRFHVRYFVTFQLAPR
jgi:hypothetical protein